MMTARYISVSEAIECTGLSRALIYQLLNNENNPLPHIKVGRVYKIASDKLIPYVESTLGAGCGR